MRQNDQGACRDQDDEPKHSRQRSGPHKTKRQFNWAPATRRYIEDVMTAAIAPRTKEFSNGLENTEDR
jgi:hypothetical protein